MESPTTSEATKLLKLCEVAEQLQLCRRTIEKMIQRQELMAIHFGRSIRIPASAVDKLILKKLAQKPRNKKQEKGH